VRFHSDSNTEDGCPEPSLAALKLSSSRKPWSGPWKSPREKPRSLPRPDHGPSEHKGEEASFLMLLMPCFSVRGGCFASLASCFGAQELSC